MATASLGEQPLTSNYLWHLRPCPDLPSGIFEEDDLSYRCAWRKAQCLANLFWHRWTRECLPTLFNRKKRNTPRRNLEVSDLVLLADESFPRGRWPLGRAIEVVPGPDGLVRTAGVKTSCTVATWAKRRRRGDLWAEKAWLCSCAQWLSYVCLKWIERSRLTNQLNRLAWLTDSDKNLWMWLRTVSILWTVVWDIKHLFPSSSPVFVYVNATVLYVPI